MLASLFILLILLFDLACRHHFVDKLHCFCLNSQIKFDQVGALTLFIGCFVFSHVQKPGMRKQLIFFEAQPKKVQLPFPSYLKNCSFHFHLFRKNWNQTEQLFYRQLYLQKWSWKICLPFA